MKSFKKTIALSLALIMTASLFGCGKDNPDSTASETTAAETTKNGLTLIGGVPIIDRRGKPYNENLDLGEVPVSGALSGTYNIVYEAEDGTLSGAEVTPEIEGYSGKGAVYPLDGDKTVTITVNIPETGRYDINLRSFSLAGSRSGRVDIDGKTEGFFYQENVNAFDDAFLRSVDFTEGEHTITVGAAKDILLDRIEIANAAANNISFKVENKLVNENSTENTKKLMKFLTDIYGKYTLSGQYCDQGAEGAEIQRVFELTGEMPAVLGLDFIEYTPSRVANGSSGRATEYAIDWYYNYGGIVQFCWHWNAPEKYLLKTSDQPWYRGFYKDATNISLDKIISGEDKEGYDLLLSDIDAIAEQLKILRDADVPILWRPLHEAAGGWFWWGACDKESYKALWNLMYDRLVNYHGINNLIWVWNGENAEWYPGDETVDIVSIDLYPGKRVYEPQFGRFYEAMQYSDSPKMVALSENGCLIDPDEAFAANARWLFTGIWNGEFVISKVKRLDETYNEKAMWEKVYSHDRVLTLYELPDMREYK